MKSNFLLFSTLFLISASFFIPQISAQEDLDFENCDGFISLEELKNTIQFDGEISVKSRPLIPTENVPGLQTWCNTSFESNQGALSMSVIVFDSVNPAIAIYDKNIQELRKGNYTINEYLTFWKNSETELNNEGLGSMVLSQYQKFFLTSHTTMTQNNETLASVDDLRKLSSIVQKKILDLPEVTISPPNPTIENDESLKTKEPPPKPGPAPIEEGKILSPKKQVDQGILPEHVICNEGLELIIKYDGSPACVKSETANSLAERGWGGPAPPIVSHEDEKHSVEIILGKQECEAAGGLWGIWGNMANAVESCNQATSDARMICTDSSQCQSFCQANEGSEINSEGEGTCYGYELAICMQEVRNGMVEPEWCR